MSDPDHRLMLPPSLRVSKHYECSSGSKIVVWDLRIGQPNVTHISMATVHSLEHFMGSLLPELSPKFINVAPMGCQTGFYIVSMDVNDFTTMSNYLGNVFTRILEADEVPLANNQQCGWAENHSLQGAKDVANWLLYRRSDWETILVPRKDSAISR